MRAVRIVETGQEFRSLSDCARFLDTQTEYIYKCLVGRLRSHKGFTFAYVDKSLSNLKLGLAIKNSLSDKTLFDEEKFVKEMEEEGS